MNQHLMLSIHFSEAATYWRLPTPEFDEIFIALMFHPDGRVCASSDIVELTTASESDEDSRTSTRLPPSSHTCPSSSPSLSGDDSAESARPR